MAKKMLIDATHPEETRVVVVDGNRVEEFDYETVTKAQISGNIYLAKVTRVEPSLQAAFVDYGGGRHGFLAFNEIHPDYYQIPVADREALIEAERQAAQQEAEEEELAAERGSSSSDDGEEKGRRGRRNSRSRGRNSDDNRNSKRGGRGRRSLSAAGDLAEAELPTRLIAKLDDGATPLPTLELPDAPALTAPEKDKPTPDFSDVESIEILETVTDENGETRVERTTLAAGGVIAERTVSDQDETVSAPAPEADADEASEIEDQSDIEASDDSDDAEADETEARGSDDDKSDDDEAQNGGRGDVEEVGAVDAREEIRPRKIRMRDYKIQEVIKRRQIMLVQVVKEERGTKGAALTTYLSLAGRYCVLMPNTARGGGISRKITNAADRKRLKAAAAELEVPEGMGLIVRTAGANRTKAEIKRDYEYLLRQWSSIRDLTLKSIAPTLIYEEGSLIKRAIRDLYSKDIDAILVEGEEGYREAKDYMKMLMPSHARHVQSYREPTPLFIRYQVESQMSAMMQPVVQLKSGGYLVIGVTEALVAIDVNSGKSTKESSIEETALKTNLEAAEEVARQMRLRDLAGLIVIDFIDMEESKNDRSVEKRLKDALKTDRARIQIGRISPFGLLEMSRQRLRPGLLEATTCVCPHCKGAGVIRSEESLALSVLRAIEEEALKGRSQALRALAPVSVANYILNQKRARVSLIEERHDVQVFIDGDPSLVSPDFRIEKAKAIQREEAPRSAAVQMDAGLLGDEIDDAEILEEDEIEDVQDETETDAAESGAEKSDGDDDASGSMDRKRRGRRGGRRRRKSSDNENKSDPLPVIDLDEEGQESEADSDDDSGSADASDDESASESRPRRRRGRSRRSSRSDDKAETSEASAEETASETVAEAAAETGETVTAESDAEPAAKAEAEPEAAAEQTEVEAEAKPKSASKPRLVEVEIAETDAPVAAEETAQAETQVETEAEVEVETEAESVAEPETAPKADAKPDPAPEPAPEPEMADAEAAEDSRPQSDKPRRTGWWAFRRGA